MPRSNPTVEQVQTRKANRAIARLTELKEEAASIVIPSAPITPEEMGEIREKLRGLRSLEKRALANLAAITNLEVYRAD